VSILRFDLVTMAAACLAVPLAVSACGGGGDGGGGPAPNPVVAIAKADPSGDAQTATVAQPLGQPLRVMVTEDGTPKSDVAVTWSAAAAGGTIEPVSPTTGADGIASAVWTLGPTAGAQTAQATASSASGSPVVFSASANAAEAAAIAAAGGSGASGVVGQPLAQAFEVRVTDEFGNGVPQVSVAWSVTGGGGSIAPATGTTGDDGIASATLTLGGAPGTNTAQAESAGLTGSPVGFTAEGTVAPAATVQVVNNQFQQASVTIDAGEVVRWTWAAGATGHNIVPVAPKTIPDQPTFHNGPFTYQVAFPTPGTYKYYCANHGSVDAAGNTSGMSGVVVVQ
jgi:plastocyanin